MNKQFITGIHAANRMWRYLGRGKPIKSLRYPQAVKVAVWEWGIMRPKDEVNDNVYIFILIITPQTIP